MLTERQQKIQNMLAEGSAVLSNCGRYRYELHRGVLSRVGFLMLNPSTADSKINDPTIRRCAGFAVDWGFAGFSVVNLYAFRSPHPAILRKAPHPIGPDNFETIPRVLKRCGLIVLAWDSDQGPISGWSSRVTNELLVEYRPRFRVLGWTKNGQPRHPLMMKSIPEPLYVFERIE